MEETMDFNRIYALIVSGGSHEVILSLIDEDKAKQPSNVESLLAAAASFGRAALVQALLDFGALPVDEAVAGAAARGHDECIDALLRAGGSAKVALDAACRAGHRNIVRIALNFDPKAAIGSTIEPAFLAAVEGGDTRIVRMLLDAGADMEVFVGNPLTRAFRAGHRRMAELLIARGADLDHGLPAHMQE